LVSRPNLSFTADLLLATIFSDLLPRDVAWMRDPTQLRFILPDFIQKKVLLLGLGGGCDIITAFALCELWKESLTEVIYANTKTGNVGPVEPVTPHVLRVTGPLLEPGSRARGVGRAKIDHSVPLHPNGSPWIVLLKDEQAEQQLANEIRSLGFDQLIGVDTGGDSIATKKGRGHLGRDQRMLAILQQTGLPLLHVVVAPGSDGESTFTDLQSAFTEQEAQGYYLGCIDLEPILGTLRSLSASLSPTRTPRIILAAAADQLPHANGDRVIVPRGCKPVVPRAWLTTGFVFAANRNQHASEAMK
jgi:hypothetical protein